MNICATCSASNEEGKMGKRCKNRFVQCGYPDGIPYCLLDEPPKNIYVMPPEQQEDFE